MAIIHKILEEIPGKDIVMAKELLRPVIWICTEPRKDSLIRGKWKNENVPRATYWKNNELDLRGAVLKSKDNKCLLVVFSALDPDSPAMVEAVVSQSTGRVPRIYEQGAKLVKLVALEGMMKNIPVHVAGISLGGGIATYAALKVGGELNLNGDQMHAYVFNPLNPGNGLMNQIGDRELNTADERITNFRVDGEDGRTEELKERFKGMEDQCYVSQVGKTYIFPVADSSATPFERHCVPILQKSIMSIYVDFLKAKKRRSTLLGGRVVTGLNLGKGSSGMEVSL